MRRSMLRCACVLSTGLVWPLVAGAQPVADVIFTNIDGHPSAAVPGVPGEQFRAPLAPFLSLYGSPSGSRWIFKAFSDNPDSNANDVIVAGSDLVGVAVAKEGQPAPLAGLTYGFFDSDCGINEAGQYAFGNRLAGGLPATDEIIFAFDGVGFVVAAQEGDPAPNLVDPAGAGNELYGNSLNSTHILADGTVTFRADLIQNVDTNFRSALYQGAVVLAQEGTNAVSGESYDSFSGTGASALHSAALGDHWIVEADILPGVGAVEAVVVDGTVEFQDGDVLAGMPSAVDAIFGVFMGGGGAWLARGDNADNSQWVVLNGGVVAASGDPTTPGATENFVTFLALSANGAGDYVVAATTDGAADADQVVVLNGETVVVSEGDPVDLDGNGLADDDVFIAAFDADDLILTDDLNDDLVDDRKIYFFGDIRDGAGTALGDALLRVGMAALPCPADLNGDRDVNAADLALLLGAWGPCAGCAADISGDDQVNAADLALLLGAWGPCP